VEAELYMYVWCIKTKILPIRCFDDASSEKKKKKGSLRNTFVSLHKKNPMFLTRPF
jgi:hypothetical protein